ncbi:hypothetical protein [Cytobacillus horneckiae]|uniref:hypothetical protein n=1 Tax=Cytobacillus horneckiae TaxID=549687 RepID=UPI003D9A35D3
MLLDLLSIRLRYHYLEQQIHRTGLFQPLRFLDRSLSHNGYVVTTIRSICGETHSRAYWPIFWLSVVVPTIVMLLAVVLYSIF